VRAFLLVVALCVAGCSKPPAPADAAPAPGADDFTAEKAKALVPEAAGVPAEELREVFKKLSGATVVNADELSKWQSTKGDTLTWLIGVKYFVTPGEAPKSSFRLLDDWPNPHDLTNAFYGPKDKDGKFRQTATLIHPEYITDCTCKVNDDTATGTVTFKADKAYEGKAEYTARKKDGAWRIEEFRLPDLKITTTLGADGKWVKK
jgi:hypothetical protein